jgi:Mrp family chromosome partitioning ATPase
MGYVGTISAGEPTLAGAAWRYRLLVVAAVVALVGVGVIYAEVRPAAYGATATMVLQDPHSSPVFAGSTGEAPDRYVGDQITVLKSPQLAAAAAAVAAAKKPPLVISADDFSAHTVVSGTASNGNLVQVTFTARNAATALAGVDAIKTAYENTVRDAVNSELSSLLAQIDGEVASINAQLARATAQQQAGLLARRDTLNAKRDQVVVDASSGSNGVTLYLAPQTTTHSSKLVTALPILSVAAVLGLVGGVLAAYVLASRRRIFSGRDEPESLLGAPLVAEIPRFARSHPLPAADGEPTAAATAFRSAALFIQGREAAGPGRDLPRQRAGSGPVRLVIVSAGRREGRSTVAANLGIALAYNGHNTLLIDADHASGGLWQLLHGRSALKAAIDSSVRLTGFGMSLENVIMPDTSPVRLVLLQAGPARPSLDDADRDKRLQDLESSFSVVIIDGPPLSDVGPSWPLVRRAESALVLITDTTPVSEIEEVSRLLGAIEIPAFGYVYNHPPRLRRWARAPEKTASPVSASSPGPGLTASA